MFIDSRELSENQLLQADACIIGGGAAGISIAREFIGTNKKIILLESGGLDYNQEIQSLYYGQNTGIPSFDLHVNRLRYFGGTTNHWAGHSRPLDSIDFEKRSWIPHSGWPITRKELDGYYKQAQSILELGDEGFEDFQSFQTKTQLKSINLDNRHLKSVVYGQSPPTRFGKIYKKELEDAANIEIYLYANVLNISTTEAASTVKQLDVISFGGSSFNIQASQFILATGGLENPRLLLLSNAVQPNGLGNKNDLVGRYFMDHILIRYALDISFTHPGIDLRLYHKLHTVAGGKKFAVITPSDLLMRDEKLTNFRAHLYQSAPRYPIPIGGVFSDLDGFKGENNLEKDRGNSIGVRLVLEPIPDPQSRVTLAEDRVDIFGQPQLNVHWLVENLDLEHAYRALEWIAVEFGRLGLGRGYSELFADKTHWPYSTEAGKHHCGTTRMANNPEQGVVDSNCKVFGIDNLYIAGSSVFPTIGYANPTLTIVALALRLTDHIKAKLV